jgi:hypothetical protein
MTAEDDRDEFALARRRVRAALVATLPWIAVGAIALGLALWHPWR